MSKQEDLSVSGAMKALENVSLDAPAAEGVDIQEDAPPKKKKQAAPVVEDDGDDVIDQNLGAEDDEDEDGATADASDADGDEGEDGSADGETTDDADGEEANDGDEGETDDDQSIDPPQSFNEEQRKVFKALPRKAQLLVAEHDKALVADHTRKTKETAELRKHLSSRIGVLRDVVTEKEKRMQKWAKVDWVAQAQRLDPKVYAANRAQFEKESREFQADKQRLQDQESADLQAHDAEQSTELRRIAPELDGKKGAPLRLKVLEACVAAGIPKEDVRWITATQMLFVHKALQWDAYQAEKKKKPTITAKPGDKAKGKVVPNAGRGQAPKNQQLAAVKKRFVGKPSRENAMSALDALDID